MQPSHFRGLVQVPGAGVAQALAWVGVLALPLLALAVHRGANTAYFLMLAGTLMGAAGLGWALVTSRQVQLQPFWSDHCGLVLAFASPLLAVLLSQWQWGEYTGRPYDGLSRLLLAMPIAWWLSQLPRQRLLAWGWAVGGGGVLAAVVLWLSVPLDDPRPVPPFATAITFGNLALLLGLFSFLAIPWRLSRSRVEDVFKVVAGLAGLYGSFLSQSRGGWLAFPVIVAALVLVVRISWRWKLAVAALTLAGLGMAYVASPMVQERVELAVVELNDYRQGRNLESSIGLRMQFWQASWEMLRDHPWSGVGSQNIQAEYVKRVEAGQMAELARTFNHSHNEFLWFMASWGIPGALALLLVYLVPLWRFVCMARELSPVPAGAGRMGVALVTGYAIFGLTEAMFAITMNVAFYAGTTAILLAVGRPGPKEPESA